MERMPVKGVAFRLDDSVRVTSGPHSGSRGRVVSLVETAPQPVYGVELVDGGEAQLRQGDLTTATAEDPGEALAHLQRWYSAQCDGAWEHELGVRIGTLDNPGWFVEINLRGTPLESVAFPETRRVDVEREWIHCRVANGKFLGDGGPHMLGAIIEVFVRWAHEANPRVV
jgi:hypothetical protein